MTRLGRHKRIAVIGGGVAGHAAAAYLLAAGSVRVIHVYPRSPGASGLWWGTGQLFGPPSAPPPGSAGAPFVRTRASIEWSRHQRWRDLKRDFPYHPYHRLGLEREEVAALAREAAALLPEVGLREVSAGRALVSSAGLPLVADVTTTSSRGAWAAAGARTAVVDCPALRGWRAPRIAAALSDATGVDSKVLHLDIFDALEGGGAHPVRVSKMLEGAAAQAAAQARAAMPQVTPDTLMLLPPCIGSTQAAADQWLDAFAEVVECRVAEAPGGATPIHGWRLDRAMRGARPPTHHGRVKSLGLAHGGIDVFLTDAEEALQVEAAIIATGRWMAGGLPRSAPLLEPLTGTPLSIDGAALARPDAWIPDLLDDRPWAAHPLFRAGLAIDAYGRPTGSRGLAVDPKLFAAGSILAGADRRWDGTAFGVDLVTGLLAAKHALHTVQTGPLPMAQEVP